MAQAGHIQRRLEALIGGPAPLTGMTTTGDRIQDRRLIEAGGKGLFTKELDEALLDGRIDLAIHSMKDLPTRLPDGIALACVPERVDRRDAFISPVAAKLMELPAGAIVGTASLRRQAQVLAARPDLRVETLRGNVETRLRKLAEGAFHATFLALAGLERLGLADRVTSLVDPDDFPPAAGQGALAVTARADDAATLAVLAKMEDAIAAVEIAAERGFLSALDGSCRTPIAASATIRDGRWRFVGEALTPDGSGRWRERIEGAAPADAREAALLGAAAGAAIRAAAGPAIVADA